ncbi:hypothetical protein QG37_05246 [Candidozyma auris]|uniref:Uncharacterized protein n=1 Tax=Candidozyma auris TaxID=498019 RepID=A0A0L0NVH5_CANAR|nr:hypothetical protein QG37_05246 [[Candida] auris]
MANDNGEQNKKKMDESGFEPETLRMLSERATNYATRPSRIGP